MKKAVGNKLSHMPDANECESVSGRLKALAHPQRLQIVFRLIMQGESNVGMLQESLELAQSTLSQHLGRLLSANIVSRRKQGTEAYYSIADERVVRSLEAFCSKE